MNGEEEEQQEQPQESQDETQHSIVSKLVESFSQEEGEKIEEARNQAMQTFIGQLSRLVEEKEAQIKELRERLELRENKAENFKRQLSELLGNL